MSEAKRLDGKKMAHEVKTELQGKVAQFKKEGITPSLTVILVGNHPASESYVRGKIRDCEEVGIHSDLVRLPEEISQVDVLSEIERLNQDSTVHGILVQLPLPKQINEDLVIQAIQPEKDVDGFHPTNVGKMVTGLDTYLSCTPHGIMEILRRSNISVAGKHVVVIGRSNIVGKPMALLLQREHATVTMCHSRTVDLAYHTQQADILIVAVGREGLINCEHVKEGAVVIDVGMNKNQEGRLVGDVVFDEVLEVASAITPVPGGVGPMTRAMLLYNTVQAADTWRK